MPTRIKKGLFEADKRDRDNVYPAPRGKKEYGKLKRTLKRLIQLRKGH